MYCIGTYFSFLHSVQTGCVAFKDCFLEVKWPRHEAELSPPSSVEFKNALTYYCVYPLSKGTKSRYIHFCLYAIIDYKLRFDSMLEQDSFLR
jgi:hypothetical protein